MRRTIAQIIEREGPTRLQAWLQAQPEDAVFPAAPEQARDFFRAWADVFPDAPADLEDPAWVEVRGLLTELCGPWLDAGIAPTAVASYWLSLEPPLLTHLSGAEPTEAEGLSAAVSAACRVIDQMSLLAIEAHLAAQAGLVEQLRAELAVLSTPLITVGPGVLAVPIQGELDATRAQQLTERLLARIGATRSEHVLIDVAGVPALDSVTAQQLVKTATAARLMGARCLVSGIRPQIAQSMVDQGLALGELWTYATFGEALATALGPRGGAGDPRGGQGR